jgi:hypothetical protein
MPQTRVTASRPKVRVSADQGFGSRRITVERPLRLNLQFSPERITRLVGEKPWQAPLTVLSEREETADICHGKPVIHGTRGPAAIIGGSLAGGINFDEAGLD